MPLAPGRLLQLDKPTLKQLRARKGDPARRTFLQKLARPGEAAGAECLELGELWSYVAWLVGRLVFQGRSLHKGQLTQIELLELDVVQAGLKKLPETQEELEAAFMAIDEAAFRYSSVPFWVTDEWKREGVTTILTPERATAVARAITDLRIFVDECGRRGHSLVVFCDQRDGMTFA